jgi:hypothetical protein
MVVRIAGQHTRSTIMVLSASITPGDGHKRQPEIAVPVFGYKNHVGIDREHGFLRRYSITHAAAYRDITPWRARLPQTCRLRPGAIARNPSDHGPANGRSRRNLVIAARFGEGPESGAERTIAKFPLRS